MKRLFLILILIIIFISCSPNKPNSVIETSPNTINNNIIGTWKLVYGEIREHDSITIKDTSTSEFIKIINETHFAFFNQNLKNSEDYYAGAGTYTLNENDYVEVLSFFKNESFRGHTFAFNLEIKGDTLIQSGIEEIKETNIKRHIIEKYIKIEDQK